MCETVNPEYVVFHVYHIPVWEFGLIPDTHKVQLQYLFVLLNGSRGALTGGGVCCWAAAPFPETPETEI
jgi:hypothetical protein